MNSLTEAEAAELEYDWEFWKRPSQTPPKDSLNWFCWLILAGRGWGKTKTGAQTIRAEVMAGRARRIALVGATAADVRDVMVEGDAGILAACPGNFKEYPRFEPSKRRLTWSNGAVATMYSAEEPARLRGPQHDLAWADELAAWKRPEAYDNLILGLRGGFNPRLVVTTTPKPRKFLRDLAKEPTTIVTRGSSYENITNLPQSYIDQIIRRYEGTALGQQELYAHLLEQLPGALWQRSYLETKRQRRIPISIGEDIGEYCRRVAETLGLVRIVVAVDPAVTATEDSNETGIIVAGVDRYRKYGFVLEDGSGTYTPDAWARKTVELYHKWGADRVVGEVNNGGDLIERTIRTVPGGAILPYKAVRASKGKAARAEPVAALYEQGRVGHYGSFMELEDQQCAFVPGDLDPTESPDRVDALVWAFYELMIASSVPVIY